MSYLLHRLEQFGDPATTPSLGCFPDFEAALAARDRDVIAQLAAHPWPAREISHLIVGPGLRGPETAHPLVTYAGVDITDPDPAGEVATVEAWLDALHAR